MCGINFLKCILSKTILQYKCKTMQIANFLLSVKNYTTLVKNNKLMFIDVEKGTEDPEIHPWYLSSTNYLKEGYFT